MPLIEGLTLVNNILVGADVRHHIKIICAGKVTSGFSIVRNLALGADLCNAARAMMFALGCIQALKCNTNKCPTGIATQDKNLMSGLDVTSKTKRVQNYQNKTVEYAMVCPIKYISYRITRTKNKYLCAYYTINICFVHFP